MTRYDTDYWLQRPREMIEARTGPHAWAYEYQENAIRHALDPIAVAGDVETVLEIGCGFGRVTKVVAETLKPRRYLATDVSTEALELAREYLADVEGVLLAPFDLNAAQVLDGEAERADLARMMADIDTGDERADLVVCTELLMHRPPERVVEDVALLCCASRRYVLTVDWYDPSDHREIEGCWQHDYLDLFADHGFAVETLLPKCRQRLILTTVAE